MKLSAPMLRVLLRIARAGAYVSLIAETEIKAKGESRKQRCATLRALERRELITLYASHSECWRIGLTKHGLWAAHGAVAAMRIVGGEIA